MIRVGVVGLGYWGPNLVRVFSENAATKVVAVADFRDDRRSKIEMRYPTVRGFKTADEMFDAGVDAVVIATPLAQHFPLALAALKAGKHVLVEKPFTATTEQADQLISESERRGLTLMVDHTFVYNPVVMHLREMISAGDLGDLLYFDSQRINLGLFQPDSDVIWDLAVHDLAILDYLVDYTPSSVSAVGAAHLDGYPENTAFMTLQYQARFIAHINVNWLSPVKVRQILISGSRRMVVYDDLAQGAKLRVFDCGAEKLAADDPGYMRRVEYRFGDMLAPYIPHSEPLANLANHFVRCIEGREKPRTGGIAGRRVIETLDAAGRSIKGRGAPISLTRS